MLVVQEGKNNYGQLDTWVPAGHVEAWRKLEVDAAIREAKEESGYTVAGDGIAVGAVEKYWSGMSLDLCSF